MVKVDMLGLSLLLIEKAEYFFKQRHLTYPISKLDIDVSIRLAHEAVEADLGFLKSLKNSGLLSHSSARLTEDLLRIQGKLSFPDKMTLCLTLKIYAAALFRNLDVQPYEYRDAVKILDSYNAILHNLGDAIKNDPEDIYGFNKDLKMSMQALWEHYKQIIEK